MLPRMVAAIVASLASIAGCAAILGPGEVDYAAVVATLGDAATDAPAQGDAGIALGPASDLATGQEKPSEIAVDDDGVYWVTQTTPDGGPSQLMKLDKTTLATSPLTSLLGDPASLAQDGTRVYVASNLNVGGDYQWLLRQEKSGGSPASFQAQSNQVLFGMTVAGGDALFIMQTAGSGPVRGQVIAVSTETWTAAAMRYLADDSDGGATTATILAADSSHVYAATNDQILRIANATQGAQSTLAKTDRPATAILLDSDADSGTAAGTVYWIEGPKILSLPADSVDAAPTLLASGQSNPRRIALHGDRIYWTNGDDGSIWSAGKKDGANPRPISQGEHDPVGIAVDRSGTVYWANRSEGRIRVARPL